MGNLVGNCCRKLFGKYLAVNSCGKILQEILREIVAGKSCRKFLWDKEEGKKLI